MDCMFLSMEKAYVKQVVL